MTVFNSWCVTLGSSSSCLSSHYMYLCSSKRLCASPPAFLTYPSFLFPTCRAERPAVLHLPAAAQLSFTHCHSTPEMGAMGSSSWLQTSVCHLLPPTPRHPSPSPASSGFSLLLHPQNSSNNQNSHGHQIGTKRQFGCKKKSSVLTQGQGWL